MSAFLGYGRTLLAYLRTPKGRHDALDAAEAAAVIAATSAAVIFLIGAIR